MAGFVLAKPESPELGEGGLQRVVAAVAAVQVELQVEVEGGKHIVVALGWEVVVVEPVQSFP